MLIGLLVAAFLAARTIHQISNGRIQNVGIGGASAQVETTAQPVVPVVPTSTNPDISIKNILVGDTESFFNDQIYIGVNYAAFDNIIFTVGSPGMDGTRIEGGSNGYSLVYRAFNGFDYDVRITKINHDLAMQNVTVEFTVTRLLGAGLFGVGK
jgi:hypothetical protein